jgi:predicted ferric reductase
MASNDPRVVILGSGKLLRLSRKRDLVEILGAFAILIPVLAFVANGGIAKAYDLASWFNALNRLSALIGTSLLLIHMILIARVPWLERILGLDKLTHAHKKLGKPLLYILVLHTITALISYSLLDQVDVVTTLLHLVGGYVDLLWALIGLALMVLVVISSINAARKKLSYEAWYLIHLTSYVAVFAAIPHQFSLGTEFLAEPLVASYFIALYLFAGFNILWFRFLVPILTSFSLGLKVQEVTTEANKTTSIVIGGKRIQSMGAEAGQFFMLRVLTARQWWRPHPFSVSSDPINTIRFTIGNRGDDTALLQETKPGTRVILEGPFGVFSESKRTRQHVLLLAAGIGVAPIRALAESLAADAGDVTVVYRVTDRSDAALLEELERICRARNHTLHVLDGPRPNGPGFLPKQAATETVKPEYARLIELAPFVAESDIYICGPAAWSHAARHSLKKLNVIDSHIHIEEFAW